MDETAGLGAARSKFQAAEVAWLVTVRADGQPQASPVWVMWDEGGLLLYSQPQAPKLVNIETNPKVCLHLDGGVADGTTVIVEGEARPSDDGPADHHPGFIAKYAGPIERLGWTPASFASDYSVPVRVAPLRLRAW